MRVKLLSVREASSDKVSSPEDVAAMMKQEAKADRECFWVLHLNSNNEIIDKELAAMGILNHSLIHARFLEKLSLTLPHP